MVRIKQGTNEADCSLERAVHDAADAHSIIAVTDADGTITYVNDNFVRLSGYSREELIGQNHSLLNSGLHPPRFFAALWEQIKSGKSWHGTICNRTKDGSTYWVDTTISPIKDEQGSITGYVSVRTDISAIVAEKNRRKDEAENAACLSDLYAIACEAPSLAEALDKSLKRLMQVSWLKLKDKGGIFLADEKARILRLAAGHNLGAIQSLCAKVKYGQCLCGRAAQSGELQFADNIDERHDLRHDKMTAHGHYNVPLHYGEELVGVLVVYLPEGAERCAEHETFLNTYASTLALIIRLKQKQIRLSDEVERSNRLAKEAQKASEAATLAAEAKANFLATMSHEIRTPMNSILGMIYLMEQTELDEEQREYAEIAKTSADSLMVVIDDILDFSKYEQGAFTLENIPVTLNDFAQSSLEPFMAPAEAKGIDLSCQVDENLPEAIMGDPTRLRQIVNNFVSNALKFTEKGRIFLKFTRTGSKDQPHLLLMVSDTGPGIEPQALDHIFERFSQADNSITRKFGGTGLGLAICKTLAEAMGGEIGVDTVLDQGSTFWVRIPLQAADEEAETETVDEDDERDACYLPLNILVAEDNPHNRFLIRKVLEAGNHQVTCVEDGLQALELVARTAFDVVLMDLQMPVLDGIAATREIRKLPAPFGTVPIYAVTANALSEHQEETRAAGMDGHINKPIQPAQVFGMLEMIMRQKQEQDGLSSLLKTAS